MRWYYLSDRQEQIPTTEEQFASMAAAGLLKPQTMVWKDGMVDWISLGEIRPDLFQLDGPGTAGRSGPSTLHHKIDSPPTVGARQPKPSKHSHRLSTLTPGSVKSIAEALALHHGWMRTSAVLLVVGGALGVIFGLLAVPAALRVLSGHEEMLNEFNNAAGQTVKLSKFPLVVGTLVQICLSGLLAWAGGLLFRAAAKTKAAGDLGDTEELTGALADLGVWFRLLTILLGLAALGSILLVVLSL